MPSRVKCVIVDDDPFMRDLLRDKLEILGGVEIQGYAEDGETGIRLIQELDPELVFLDVEMTDMTGFDMLAKLEDVKFQTIFVTSYGHYAIKAIRTNALDYLLKPIDLQDLKEALERFRLHKETPSAGSPGRNISAPSKSERLMIKTQEGEFDLLLQDIIVISGEGNYSNIIMTENRKLLLAKTLSDMEPMVDDRGFFRCHKSHIVNSVHITQVKGEFIRLGDGTDITMARRRKSDFLEWWNAVGESKQ